MRIIVAFFAFVVLSIAGCQQTEAPTESKPAVVAAPVVAPPAAPAGAMLSVDPAALPVCDKTPHIATLRWDVSKVPIVGAVEIWMNNPGEEPKLFGQMGKTGEKQTGAWIRAGSRFMLRDASGAELSHIEVAGIPCP